eukprot:COSAG06_NODE_5262_length_3601_cov_77.236722_8_plen_54_part_00
MDPEEQLKVLGERARGNKNAGKEERARHERYNISLSLCLLQAPAHTQDSTRRF